MVLLGKKEEYESMFDFPTGIFDFKKKYPYAHLWEFILLRVN